MIVIDTSALIAILLAEPDADACADALQTGEALLISAGTLAEARIVAARRDRATEMEQLVEGLGLDVVPVAAATADRIAAAYRRWGKGNHAAALNFGDCFAYAVATERDCPLLYVGDDFTRTDVKSALPR